MSFRTHLTVGALLISFFLYACSNSEFPENFYSANEEIAIVDDNSETGKVGDKEDSTKTTNKQDEKKIAPEKTTEDTIETKADSIKVDTTKIDTSKVDSTKKDSTNVDTAYVDTTKADTTKGNEDSTETKPLVPEITEVEPALLSYNFQSNSNAGNFTKDFSCKIRNNDILECFAKETLKSNELIATFEFTGDSVTLTEGTRIQSKTTSIDYGNAISLNVHYGEKNRTYEVHLYPYTGLPYISIETANGQDITDKKSLRDATIRIMEDPDNQEFGVSMNCGINGHGNSTWTDSPKKPYAIKFNKKTSLFSLPKGKSWNLIANYFDKTMVRNSAAMYLSSISSAPYTPKFQFVELILNGKHRGTYQLFEKVNGSKERLNLNDNDFLLEVDNHPRSKDIYITLGSLPKPVKIHSPDNITENDVNYNYIKTVLEDIEKVLFSENFLDEEEGYKKYIDIDALVEWFVVTEITENSSNRVNWYMSYERNGKLKMGPFWDYDLAFGNSLWALAANNTDQLWMTSVTWFKQFMKDPEFTRKVKERFNYFYTHKADLLNIMNENAQKIKTSAMVNNDLWNIFECDSCSPENIEELYNSEVAKMTEWTDAHIEWLKSEFDSFAE